MFTFQTARVVLFIYTLLLAGGGVMGFVKAGSRPSLIAGVGSAAATLIALGVSFWRPYEGLVLATVVALFLCLFFNYRFVSKSRKFMPSGLLAVVSLVVLGVLIIAII
jgi:uncharacterized membrane protein (UPF0136 family)